MDKKTKKDDIKVNPKGVDPKKYIVLNCSEDCKIGWIYTNKTNILVDSNEPPK
jgi:hypothetical protein